MTPEQRRYQEEARLACQRGERVTTMLPDNELVVHVGDKVRAFDFRSPYHKQIGTVVEVWGARDLDGRMVSRDGYGAGVTVSFGGRKGESTGSQWFRLVECPHNY